MNKETSDVSKTNDKFYVYVIFSLKDKGLYIGYTTDLKNRLISHNKGQNTATKLRIPFKLIYAEYFINKSDAKSREKYLKSGYGRRQLAQILKSTFQILKPSLN